MQLRVRHAKQREVQLCPVAEDPRSANDAAERRQNSAWPAVAIALQRSLQLICLQGGKLSAVCTSTTGSFPKMDPKSVGIQRISHSPTWFPHFIRPKVILVFLVVVIDSSYLAQGSQT